MPAQSDAVRASSSIPRRPTSLHGLVTAGAIIAALALCALAASLALRVHRILEPAPLPAVAPVDTFAALFDVTPVRMTVTVEWQKVPMTVPAHQLTSDHTLWQKMHFEDWDKVPSHIRETALSSMVTKYRAALGGPRVWARMTAEDWDRIPQPIRAMAFVRMARHWGRHYQPGGQYDLSRALVADTVAAIVMAESWFEHRGSYTNPDGTRDMGLGGASDFCRTRMRDLHALGVVDVGPADGEYFNPWIATRVVAIWLGLMVDEAEGDLERAVAAYNTGIAHAWSADGQKYSANVRRKRHRFIRNIGAPPSWTFLSRQTARPRVAPRRAQ
jgi:hypothetical protein